MTTTTRRHRRRALPWTTARRVCDYCTPRTLPGNHHIVWTVR